MADVQGIATWIVKIEDDPRHPGIAKDLGDGAGITRYGITQRWHAADVPADFFTTMDNVTANGVSHAFYVKKYCGPMRIADISSIEIASPLVSFAVNDTIHEAVKELQGVLGLTPDGVIGPITVNELNSKDGVITAKLFRASWEDFYRRDVMLHPNKIVFINGWLNRVKRLYPS